MNNTDLPPLPSLESTRRKDCTLIRRYLAIAADLSDEQRQLLFSHLHRCPDCANEWQLLDSTTRRVASLEASQPSARVDQAVMAAITASARQQARRQHKRAFARSGFTLGIAACVGAVAMAVVLTVANLQNHFQLPASLAWNNYVLYHTQTMTGSDGKQYQVQTYHNMATDQMNVETVMGNQLDIQTVSDSHQTLGMDMMHHVAQWDANAWSTDDSMFDLAQLRKDLSTGKATYLGKDTFNEQTVYRIRMAPDMTLLLDMNYMPVNVLETTNQQSVPMYQKLSWLTPSQVPNSMWQMDVPSGFKMGQLPAHPQME